MALIKALVIRLQELRVVRLYGGEYSRDKGVGGECR